MEEQLSPAYADGERRGTMKVECCNFVGQISLGCKIDLKKIAMRMRTVDHGSRVASVLFRNPRAVAIIFPNGTSMVMGLKSEADCRRTVRKLVWALRRIGYPQAQMNDYQMRNGMSKAMLPYKVDLPSVASAHPDVASFEPELSSSLVYSVCGTTKALVYESGSVLIMGSNNEAEAQHAFNLVSTVLAHHQKVI